MPKKSSRRDIIKSGLSAGGLAMAGWSALGRADSSRFTDQTVRVGLIGCGNRGLAHILAMKALKNIKIVAICDTYRNHRNRGLAANIGGKGYSNYKELLADQTIDAVAIATPLDRHYQIAWDALDEGKHVFCEKTMTYDVAQAASLVQKVRDTGLIFQTGYQYPYNSVFKKVRKIIQDGNLGQIVNVECQWNRNGDWRRSVSDPAREREVNWRMYREYSKGLMAELGCHHLDYVNDVLKAYPVRATGFGGINYWKDGRETYDNISTLFSYENGVKTSFTSLTANAYDGFAIRFKGDKGTIRLTDSEAYYVEEGSYFVDDFDALSGATSSQNCGGTPIPGDRLSDATVNSFAAFRDAIHSGQQPISDVVRGAKGVAIVSMTVDAMLKGSIETWKPEYNFDS